MHLYTILQVTSSSGLLIFGIIGSILVGLLLFFVIRMIIFSRKKYDKAEAAMKGGNYKEAINHLKKIVSRRDDDSYAYYLLGECHFLTKNYEWAVQDYKRVLKFGNYNSLVKQIDVRKRMAQIYIEFNQLDEAQKELLLIVKMDPKNDESYFQIAKLYLEKNYVDQAFNYFNKTLSVNPNHIESLFYVGEIHFLKQQPTECLAKMQQVIKLEPEFYRAHFYLAMVHMNGLEFRQAMTEFEKAFRDSEYRLRCAYGLGKCYKELGELQKAIDEFIKGIPLIKLEDNTSLKMRYDLADCFEKLRDIPSAITQWEKITAASANYLDVQSKLAAYQDLRMSDVLKDFMIAGDDAFLNISEKIVQSLDLEVVESETRHGTICKFIGMEAENQWRNTRRIKAIVYVYRTTEPLSESPIREMLDAMKTVSAAKCICITSSEFTNHAVSFAESRPVRLIDKEGLIKILNAVDGISKRGTPKVKDSSQS